MKAGRHILVLGARRGIGMETIKVAVRSGCRVHAFLRSVGQVKVSDALLEKRRGGVLNNAGIDSALEGIGVIIKALGGGAQDLFASVKLFSKATCLFVTTMKRRCVSRLISVAGFDANNSRSANNCLHLLPFWIFLEQDLGDKAAQEHWIKDRALGRTIARRGVLVPGLRCGPYKALIVPSR